MLGYHVGILFDGEEERETKTYGDRVGDNEGDNVGLRVGLHEGDRVL